MQSAGLPPGSQKLVAVVVPLLERFGEVEVHREVGLNHEGELLQKLEVHLRLRPDPLELVIVAVKVQALRFPELATQGVLKPHHGVYALGPGCGLHLGESARRQLDLRQQMPVDEGGRAEPSVVFASVCHGLHPEVTPDGAAGLLQPFAGVVKKPFMHVVITVRE